MLPAKCGSKTKNSENIFTHSEASCCSYKAQMLSYMLPTFSDEFKTAIENLPESYTTVDDKEKYQEIIDTFGTHYIHQITMGSLFGQESEISKEELKKSGMKSTDINAAASYSGFGVTASAKFADQSQTATANDFQKMSSHQRVYTLGPPPPEGNDMISWAKEANKSPEPISQKLKSIINLLERQDSLDINEAVMGNLKTAFNNYCTYLKELGLVSNCNPHYPEASCPIEWTTLQTGCYRFIEASSFLQANTRCNEMGGFIAEIKSQKEQDAFSQFMRDSEFSNKNVWLGGTIVGNTYIWFHSGEKITFSAWAPGSPSGGDERCFAAWGTDPNNPNKLWNDIVCDQHATVALCQHPLVSG